MVSEVHHINGCSNHYRNTMEIAQSSQELSGPGVVGRWKTRRIVVYALGAGVFLLGIIIIIAIIFGMGLIMKPFKVEFAKKSRPPTITFEDMIQGLLAAQDFNATWVTDTMLLYKDTPENVLLYDVVTGTKRIILPSNHSTLSGGIEHVLSADSRFLLVSLNYRKLYRHSYLAEYYILEIETGVVTRVVAPGPGGEGISQLQQAVWSPVGHALAFIYINDLYYLPAPGKGAIRITRDGVFGVIYNAVPDWVYEEEVFSSNSALWWSPDGKRLAFGSFNDSMTRTMTVPFYGRPGLPDFQYPIEQHIRYPKAGTPNPTVKLSVVDLEEVVETRTVRKINLPIPTDLAREEPILATVSWATNTTVSAIWMNRNQYKAQIIAYETTNQTMNIVTSLSQNGGWLELFTEPLWSRDGNRVALIVSHEQQGDVGAFRHLTLYERNDTVFTPRALTFGAYVVTKIVAWDEKTNYIYYLANTAEDYAVQHLYRILDNNKDAKPECFTCDIINKATDKPCLYNNAEFSTSNSYFALKCSGPSVPEVSIWNTKNKSRVNIWTDNPELRALIKEKTIPLIERMTVPLVDNLKAQVHLKLPVDIDRSGHTKYPLLINVYGGPDSYRVTERFNLDWESYLVVNKSIIIASIDGRGSGLKGDRILFAGYRKLGSVEINDQINVTRYLQQHLKYIDANRTAIWGWSYGGYASGMVLAADKENVFRCGIAVAPVTDWALYDSIYTERFMGQPTISENSLGYEASRLTTPERINTLKQKKLLLAHGLADDNVHYQQAALLARALELADAQQLRQLSYPDEDHSLAAVRPHLYHSLERFLGEECFTYQHIEEQERYDLPVNEKNS